MRRSKGGGSMTGLGWTIPVLLVQLLLPVAAAMTGALHSWPVTGVICILAAALMVAGCSSDREHILKIYNWSDYMEESLIGDFEKWYEEQTGEKVKIVYQTFDINETMLSKIEKGHEDYDVVCPSDYIIERMIRYDLLLPIDQDFGDTPNYIKSGVSPYLMDRLKELRTGDVDPTKYAVPYMWGTVGFIFNPKYVDREDLKTWDVLRNHKYEDKIFVKDAARDIYSQIIQYLKKDGYYTLLIGFVRLQDNKLLIPYSNSFRKTHRKIEIVLPPILLDKKVKEIRIIPRSDGRFFEIQYTYEAGFHIKKELDLNKALSIDVGIHNLATCVTDEGRSFLLDGKRLKSINQWYNKNNARLQSIKDKQHLSFKTRQQSSLEMYLVI